MHIIFTDEEMEWLDTSKSFAWKIKDKCPQRIKEVLSKKLELLYKHREDG
jgi:hypothetical protein